MFNQTFSLIDIPRLFTLIFLEGILSLDNALAIALIVRGITLKKRQKALFIGIISSIILRSLGILGASLLIQAKWVKILGGLYLIYLSISHLIQKHSSKNKAPKTRSFWKTVILIEFTDFIFAIDSILAGLALIGATFHPPNLPSKIWIVYFGGISGLVLMRFAAKIFTNIIDRFPLLELGAHLIVGWIGLKLFIEVWLPHIPLFGEIIFWTGIILFFLIGLRKKSNVKKI